MLLPSVGRRIRGDATLALSFLAGAVAGALSSAVLLYLLCALLSPVPTGLAFAVGTTAAAAVALLSLVRGGCPLWQTRRQISAEVVLGRQRRGAFVFAYQLGTGLVTYLPSCAPHVLAALLVFLPLPVYAPAVAACGFGVGRSAGFLLRMTLRARNEFEDGFQRSLTVVARTAPLAVLALVVSAALR